MIHRIIDEKFFKAAIYKKAWQEKDRGDIPQGLKKNDNHLRKVSKTDGNECRDSRKSPS